MEKEQFSMKNWIVLVLFGLVGQIAWAVENMYFNLFIFDTIAPNLDAITLMVQLSGVVATLTTLVAGTVSDKTGNRRKFISYGYAIWGVTVALFALISPQNIAKLLNTSAAKSITVALALVIALDCVMTVFGSTANDAAFNAWVTDNTREEYRGKVEGVLAVLPLAAMLVVAGGFGMLVEAVGYKALFLGLGIVISLCGVGGIFLIQDSPTLEKNGTLKDIVYGFKPSVVKENQPLYVVFLLMGIYGVACQIFMPYLIIYMKTFLNFTVFEYSAVFAIAIVFGGAINVYVGTFVDEMDKRKLLYSAVGVMAAGLLGMFFAHFESKPLTIAVFGISGFIMITGYILVSALCGALARDYTPKADAGKLQGVRMIFAVLIPMLAGPMIGNLINKKAAIPLPEAGTADSMTTQYIPAPGIFLAAALTLLLMVFLLPVLKRVKRKKGIHILKTRYEIGEIPHAEHPAPQAMREDWLCLNGRWTLKKLSPEGETRYEGEILVPFSPETLNSGVEKGFVLGKGESLTYKRSFTLQSSLMRGVTLLHFGAVDSECEVFVNGVKVGGHSGGYTAFTLDVSEVVKEGENEIIVHCKDEGTRNGDARGKQSDKRGGIWYTPQSGIWQTVWLESMPKNHIKGLKITPDAQTKRVKIEVLNEGEQEIAVFDGDKEIIRKTFEKQTVLEYDFRLWSPEEPNLYDFKLMNADGDCLRSYFGVRSFGIAEDKQGKKRLTLNGKPYFFNGVLDQGYWSDGMLTYPSDRAAVEELQLLKKMGFNTVRKHIKLEPMRWYYHCDRLGLAVWQDFVNGGGKYNYLHIAALPFLGFHYEDNEYEYFAREDEWGRAAFKKACDETLAQLYNCTSIAVWVPFNEGWGQFESEAFTIHVRSKDSTRIIDSVSGWHDQGVGKTELLSLHTYYTPLRVPEDSRPVVLSEFGGYSMYTDDHVYDSRKEFGYKTFDTKAELEDALKKLYLNKLLPLISEGLCAAIYTQVSDVEEEINGFVTYDREVVKVSVEFMNALNTLLMVEAERVKLK